MKGIIALVVAVGALFAVVTLLKSKPASAPDHDRAEQPGEDRDRVRRFWDAYRQATDHRIAGELSRAAEAYTRALVLNPEHQDALYYLGNTRFELGDFAAAERAWRRLVEVDPTNARGHSQLGLLYSCVGAPQFLDPTRAAAEFQRALAINREETGPLLHLGEIALLTGRLEAAGSYLDSVVGSNYSSVEAHYYQGYIAWKEGASRDAVARLAEAVRHARPKQPAAGVPGEGDTEAGRQAVIASTDACRPMRVRVEELAVLEPGEVPERAARLYGDLDELLDRLRPTLRQ